MVREVSAARRHGRTSKSRRSAFRAFSAASKGSRRAAATTGVSVKQQRLAALLTDDSAELDVASPAVRKLKEPATLNQLLTASQFLRRTFREFKEEVGSALCLFPSLFRRRR